MNNEQLFILKCFNCNKQYPQKIMRKLICSHFLCSNCIGLLLFNNSFNNNHIGFNDICYSCFCSKGENRINQCDLIAMLKELSEYNNRDNSNNNNIDKCNEHNQAIECYCKECSLVLCSICIKSHNTHRLLTITDYNDQNSVLISRLTHKALGDQKASLMSLQLIFESTYTRESNKIFEKIDYIIDAFTKIKQRIKDEYSYQKNHIAIIDCIYNHFYYSLNHIQWFSNAKKVQLDFSGVLIDSVNANMDIIANIAQMLKERNELLLNDSILKYRFIMKPFELKYSSHKKYFIKKRFQYNTKEGIPKKIIQLSNLSIAVGFSTEMIHIYDHIRFDLIKTMKGKENNAIASLIELDDGRLLSGSLDTTMKLWDMHHSNYVEEFESHLTSTTALIQLRNKLIVSGSNNGELKLWDLRRMKQLQTIKPHQYKISSYFQLSNDRLASASFDCYIKIFKMNDDSSALIEECSLYKLLSKINSIIELRDKSLCSVDSGVNVSIWNVEKKVVLYSFKAHSMEILSVINLKNSRIATASVDTLIKIWEIKDKITLVQSIEMHTSPINAIIQLKNKRIVSASTDLMIFG